MTTQLELTVDDHRRINDAQCAKILHSLSIRRGQWVPMTLLEHESGSHRVAARIHQLRRMGHNITGAFVAGGRLYHYRLTSRQP